MFCTKELLSKEECKATSDYCEIQNATHSGIDLPSMIFCNCCPYCLEYIRMLLLCNVYYYQN